MRAENVLGVLSALEAKRVGFHLAGGWGVDALEGWETRSHDDLAVVIDDYGQDIERAVDALASLGFRVVTTQQRETWVPQSLVLRDGSARRVELVSLDRQRLAGEFAPNTVSSATRNAIEKDVYSEGTVQGRQVPCLSAVVQLLYHTGFELGPSQNESGLFLPVPTAEAHVGKLRQKFDPGSMPAHVTILYPFVPPQSISGAVVDALSELLENIEPFEFTLPDIEWFDERVMYLAPHPRASFVELTTRVSQRFPGHPPYRGKFGEVIPHLTVGEGARPARMRRAGRRLQQHLPISALATRLWLMTPDGSGRWALRLSFPLGRPLR